MHTFIQLLYNSDSNQKPITSILYLELTGVNIIFIISGTALFSFQCPVFPLYPTLSIQIES